MLALGGACRAQDRRLPLSTSATVLQERPQIWRQQGTKFRVRLIRIRQVLNERDVDQVAHWLSSLAIALLQLLEERSTRGRCPDTRCSAQRSTSAIKTCGSTSPSLSVKCSPKAGISSGNLHTRDPINAIASGWITGHTLMRRLTGREALGNRDTARGFGLTERPAGAELVRCQIHP